jgi:predicted HicB family RNase H-like nuclease
MPAKPSPEPEEEQKAIIVRIPADWHEELRQRAFRDRTSISELARHALETAYPNLPKREKAGD